MIEPEPTVEHPDHRCDLIPEAGCHRPSLELVQRILECFEHPERLIEAEHQTERYGVIIRRSFHPTNGTEGV